MTCSKIGPRLNNRRQACHGHYLVQHVDSSTHEVIALLLGSCVGGAKGVCADRMLGSARPELSRQRQPMSCRRGGDTRKSPSQGHEDKHGDNDGPRKFRRSCHNLLRARNGVRPNGARPAPKNFRWRLCLRFYGVDVVGSESFKGMGSASTKCVEKIRENVLPTFSCRQDVQLKFRTTVRALTNQTYGAVVRFPPQKGVRYARGRSMFLERTSDARAPNTTT